MLIVLKILVFFIQGFWLNFNSHWIVETVNAPEGLSPWINTCFAVLSLHPIASTIAFVSIWCIPSWLVNTSLYPNEVWLISNTNVDNATSTLSSSVFSISL